jgi:hypothetical protein
LRRTADATDTETSTYEDANRKGEHGRPFVIGGRQEIIREEPEVVRRIMLFSGVMLILLSSLAR